MAVGFQFVLFAAKLNSTIAVLHLIFSVVDLVKDPELPSNCKDL